MEQAPVDVFFYGLYMDEDFIKSKGVTPTRMRRAVLHGFDIRIGDRATLVPSKFGEVHGMVVSLSHEGLNQLYAGPGLRDYRPEAVLIEMPDEDPIAAMVFKAPRPPAPNTQNAEYVTRLRALCKKLDFPPEYLEKIR